MGAAAGGKSEDLLKQHVQPAPRASPCCSSLAGVSRTAEREAEIIVVRRKGTQRTQVCRKPDLLILLAVE